MGFIFSVKRESIGSEVKIGYCEDSIVYHSTVVNRVTSEEIRLSDDVTLLANGISNIRIENQFTKLKFSQMFMFMHNV